MKIALINVSIQEPSAFEADIVLNNEVVGKAFNLGDGSSTQYLIESKEKEQMISNYCDSIPKELIKISENQYIEIKFNIEQLINSLIEAYYFLT